MYSRNLPFATPEESTEIAEKIMSLFFPGKDSLFRFRYKDSFTEIERVNLSIFLAPFFLDTPQILVCFPSHNTLEVHLSKDQKALSTYLQLEETVDWEGDIYLFPNNFSWCIRYIDEFYSDGSPMIFLASNEPLI